MPWLLDAVAGDAAAELVRRHPNGIGRLGRPSQRLEPAAAAQLANAIQDALIVGTCLGIPALFNEEDLHGHMAIPPHRMGIRRNGHL